MTFARLPTVLLAGVAGLALVAALVLTNLALAAPPPTPTPTPVPAAITGKHLFLAKGCTTCHRHDDALPGGRTFSMDQAPPDLTKYRNDPNFLRSWLKDPRAVRANTQMPDLGLKQGEIEALIAFLNNPDLSK